jgi:8-oxo-dGTP diphosphatase
MTKTAPDSEMPGRPGAEVGDEPATTVAVYVVRHAHAQPRDGWTGSDSDRPLTDRGVKEAQALVDRFDTGRVRERTHKSDSQAREPTPTLLLSSGAARCRATLRPLARACGAAVETAAYLSEGSDAGYVLGQLKNLAASRGVKVLCTHGDVIWGTLKLLEKAGVHLDGPVDVKKGSIWVLEFGSGSVKSARYIPPGKV